MIYSSIIPEIKDAIFLPDKRIFNNLYNYISFGVPATFMLSTDFFAVFAIDIVAGYLGVTELAT